MKNLIFICLFLVISCDSNSQENITRISDSSVVKLMMLGEVLDLNKLQENIEKNLWLKIYKVPNTSDNECFPESHGICDYKYYLATSQLDDSPILNAYYLGVIGEIIEYEWQETQNIDTAIIKISANKYSKEALAYNKSLQNRKITYQITATPDNVEFMKVN